MKLGFLDQAVWRQELAVAKIRRKNELAKQAELRYKADRLTKRLVGKTVVTSRSDLRTEMNGPAFNGGHQNLDQQ